MAMAWRWALIGCTAGLVGCGSSDGSSVESELHPTGFPFVVEAAAVSDVCGAPVSSCAAGRNPQPGATTATLTQPEDGKLCFTGAVSGGGYAFAVLIFTEYNDEENKVLTRFNADALGIDRVAFTLDSPPSAGVTVVGAIVKQLDCPGSANATACRTSGFSLVTAPGSQIPLSITQAGEQIAPFVSFEQTNPGSGTTFDTTALDSFAFFVGAGPYAFCIHDFKFLDAAGDEIKPPAP